MCVNKPNFIKIGQTVAEMWRFNGFQNGDRPPSWILEIRIFVTVGEAKKRILHQHAKFRSDQSNHGGDIAISVIFQDGGHRHLEFSKVQTFNV